jgi:hypothetical protein
MPKIRQGTSQINFKNSASIDRVFTPAVSGPVNLVSNPSFTSTDLTGWESSLNKSRDIVDFKTAPASLKSSLYYDDAPFLKYQKSSILTPGQRYSLSFWFKGGYPYEPIEYYLTAIFGGTYAFSSPLLAPNIWHNIKVENILCGPTTSFEFQIGASTSDWDLRIDDVSVVLGPTALVL